MRKTNEVSGSRRSFLQASAMASAAVAWGAMSEPLLARAAAGTMRAEGMVHIDANENPLGPCTSAREAVAAMAADGGRYLMDRSEELANQIAKAEGLQADRVMLYPGSSNPLHYVVLAYTSPQKPYVTADPGFEAGMMAADAMGVPVIKVPLTKTYAHDVKAMLAAGPNAGVFYVCTPNNPTGTLTSHSDIEYLVEHKPKGSIVLVDEAYIHFSDAPTAVDLVKADKEIIVLRTFSKLYGMAGLRCGMAIGRPDLLAKMEAQGGWNAMPVTAVAAAKASLNHAGLVEERRRVNREVRQETFAWLDSHGYSYIPSESNCFLLDSKRDGKSVIAAMAKQNVMIGRIWPVLPTHVRITVGTRDEMRQFQTAFEKVMSGATVGWSIRPQKPMVRHMDGVRVRG